MRALCLILAASLVGCAAEPKMMWVRADGQGGPAARTQYEMDNAACLGEMQRANLSGSSYCRGLVDCVGTGIVRNQAMATVGKGCMASKGYLERPVPESVVKGTLD